MHLANRRRGNLSQLLLASGAIGAAAVLAAVTLAPDGYLLPLAAIAVTSMIFVSVKIEMRTTR